MRYFLDTEFIEDFHKPLFGKRRHYIDLISIGIVAEDGREYYAISNEFDVDYAWNKFEWKERPIGSTWHKEKDYWLRENVLWPLVNDAVTRYSNGDGRNRVLDGIEGKSRRQALKWIIKKYGKSNKQIAKEVRDFVAGRKIDVDKEDWILALDTKQAEFWGYYADYDWVLLCSLFGKMIDLPLGFPKHCRDLKQELDMLRLGKEWVNEVAPKPKNEHNALADARWNRDLYDAMFDDGGEIL